MKIRWLRITGIGPFAGVHTLDFSAFDDSGLFLLEGPTGSGKSTLIDAITFALYGDVARTKDASKDRLRSNHIGDSDPSEADLVFEVSSGIYRVTRTPAYTPVGKKSQRNSRSTLTRVVEDPDAPDGWRTVDAIASGPRDVGLEIPRIVGLDKDQFLQTIVLPQGKFSQFLTATSDSREHILRDIFDTQIYTDFTRALADAAAASRHDIDRLRAEAVAALDHMRSLDAALGEEEEPEGGVKVQASAILADQLDAGAEDACDVARWARAACDRGRALHERTQTRARRAFKAAREASQALTEARALADDQAEYARTNRRLEELTQARADIDAARTRAGEARRALAIAPHATADEAARERLEAAGDQVVALAPAVAAGGADPLDPRTLTPEAVADLCEEAQRVRDQATRRRGALEASLNLERSLPGLREEIRSLTERRDAASERIATLEDAREALPQAIQRASDALALMRADADCLPEQSAALRALDQRLDASQQADLLRSALLGASDTLREATVRAKLANAAAADGHDLWIAQSASALAQQLEPDSPCPVCGSPTHPAPAPPTQGDITREQVAQLDRARDQAVAALGDAQAAHQDLVRRIAQLNAAAGAPTATLESQRDEAAAHLAELEALKPRIADLEGDIAQVRAQLDGLTGELTQARENAASLTQSLRERRASLEQATARVESERAGAESLDARAAQLDESAQRAAHLVRACSDFDSAHRAHDDAHRALARALSAQELDADSWRGLLLPEDQVDAAEARVAAHEKETFAVTEALASPRLVRAATAAAPNVAALTEASQGASRISAEAAKASGKLEQHCTQLDAAHDALSNALSHLARARAQAGPIRRLANIASASGPENLAATPLSAWVLISRLEEVLAAANPRLTAISSGRYELVAVLDDGTASRKSGLGLAVIDHDTDAVRSPRTLSGGETFYTSLALALGLADVVSAEAGGVELRTMFIDEGFGSLDSHTLSLVMNQLQALRSAGRTVGVISHVEEMATQIADQIQVRPLAESGSTLRVRA